MAEEYDVVTVPRSYMEEGEFYFPEVNLNSASNVRNVKTITEPLAKATQDIVEIKAKNESQDIEINKLGDYFEDYKEVILDNQARINNLEDVEIKKIMGLVDKWSIRANFQNATHVEIQHFRKHITSVKVMRIDLDVPLERIETNVTAGTNITERFVKDQQGNIVSKIVVLDFGNTPITGYIIIL